MRGTFIQHKINHSVTTHSNSHAITHILFNFMVAHRIHVKAGSFSTNHSVTHGHAPVTVTLTHIFIFDLNTSPSRIIASFYFPL